MDFSKYMIVTDLDGTYLYEGKPGVRNREAVEAFKAGGGLFTVATGRLHINVRSSLPDIAELCNAPVIFGNGAYIYEWKTQQSLMSDMLSCQNVEAFLAFVAAYCPEVSYRVSARANMRSPFANDLIKRDVMAFDPGISIIGTPPEEWPHDDWYKVSFRDEPEVLEAVRRDFEAVLGDRMDAVRTGKRFLEVIPKGITKALGVEKLRRYFGATDESHIMIACGDYENDIPMLQAADIALCPENAIPAVKAVCHGQLCHCKDGFVAEVIEAIATGKIEKGAMTV